LFQGLHSLPIRWRLVPAGWFRENLIEMENQCWPISKVMGLTADHMLEFAAPFQLAFTYVGSPNPQREKVTLERTRSVIHGGFSYSGFSICIHVHQDNKVSASEALREDSKKRAV